MAYEVCYTASTDKVERNDHFPVSGRNYCNEGVMIFERCVARMGKNLGGESCSSNWKLRSDSCVDFIDELTV